MAVYNTYIKQDQEIRIRGIISNDGSNKIGSNLNYIDFFTLGNLPFPFN